MRYKIKTKFKSLPSGFFVKAPSLNSILSFLVICSYSESSREGLPTPSGICVSLVFSLLFGLWLKAQSGPGMPAQALHISLPLHAQLGVRRTRSDFWALLWMWPACCVAASRELHPALEAGSVEGLRKLAVSQDHVGRLHRRPEGPARQSGSRALDT